MIESITGSPTWYDLIFIIGGLFGMLTHYLKKRVSGAISISPLEYFGKNNWAASLLTLIAFFIAMFGALASGVPKEMNFYLLIYLSFVTGYTVDSGFNRIDEDRERHFDNVHVNVSVGSRTSRYRPRRKPLGLGGLDATPTIRPPSINEDFDDIV